MTHAVPTSSEARNAPGLHARAPRGLQRLKTRLFLWFLAAIVLAVASSALTVHLTRPEQNEGPVRTLARAVGVRLARDWDDPRACDAYTARLKEQFGIEMRVVRGPDTLPSSVKRAAQRNAALAFSRDDGHAYIPVVRGGELLGAAVFESGPPPAPQLVRLGSGLAVALIVLALAAVRVSRQLARPLEQVAIAAEHFGAGDLTARAGMETGPRRWVASEVAEVAGAFDRMAARIEAVVRDQRELLAAISHELRSPLGRARVALEIARDRSEGALPPALLDDVERPLGEVDAILGDLLAAARAGLSDVRTVKTKLLPWLRTRVAAESAPPVVEIVAPEDAEPLEVSIDSALLARALHNVLANAKNHGHPPGLPIEVRVEVGDPSRARIVVRDRGPGFTPELLPRVFEPFVRGDAARTPREAEDGAPGAGLGLALVSRIAEAHGGRAFARNCDGETGAEVGIELPLSAR